MLFCFHGLRVVYKKFHLLLFLDNYSGENFGQLIGYVSLTSGAVS